MERNLQEDVGEQSEAWNKTCIWADDCGEKVFNGGKEELPGGKRVWVKNCDDWESDDDLLNVLSFSPNRMLFRITASVLHSLKMMWKSIGFCDVM